MFAPRRFANGTQGWLLHWAPGATDNQCKAIPAYCHRLRSSKTRLRGGQQTSVHRLLMPGPDLVARFCKESALLSKSSLLPDVDFMDVGVRQETLQSVRGEPIML